MSEKWMQKKDASLYKIIKDAKLKTKKNAEEDFKSVYEKDVQMSNTYWQRIILEVRNFSTFRPITASLLASFIGFFLSFIFI